MGEVKYCSFCGHANQTSFKFCEECGSPLQIIKQALDKKNLEPINIAPDDKNLKLLVDTCSRVGPLAGGKSRYSELVLYVNEEDKNYQVHSYSSDSVSPEHHWGYYVSEEFAMQILETIREDQISKLVDEIDLPITGGSFVLKFLDDDGQIIRLEANEGKRIEAYRKISTMLAQGVAMKNMIVPEYAKSWKKLEVNATGSSMNDCYHISLEKTEDGTICAKGDCFDQGNRLEKKEWITVSEAAYKKLMDIPFGMQISQLPSKVSGLAGMPDFRGRPMGMMGMMGNAFNQSKLADLSDGSSNQCQVTYGDDRVDRKLPDQKMMRSLLEVMIVEFQ